MRSYPPLCRCVYCGAVEVDLSREHLVPLSLGGTTVLRRASCHKHRDLTSNAEMRVARIMYGIVRQQDGIRTRRPGRAGRELISAETFDGRAVEVSVPAADVPRIRLGAAVDAPWFLRSDEVPAAPPQMRLMRVRDEEGMQRLLQKYNLKSGSFCSHVMEPGSLLRVIAKISHVFVVAELGFDSVEPLLLPIIEGAREGDTIDVFLKFVGGYGEDNFTPAHELSWRREEIRGASYAIVDVCLKAFPLLPCFQVVAARLKV